MNKISLAILGEFVSKRILYVLVVTINYSCSDGMTYETSLALFSLSHWSSVIQSQFMVGRRTPYTCATSGSCTLRFQTTSVTQPKPYLISANSAYNRGTDVFTCQTSGPHLFSWSVGVDGGNAVSTTKGHRNSV